MEGFENFEFLFFNGGRFEILPSFFLARRFTNYLRSILFLRLFFISGLREREIQIWVVPYVRVCVYIRQTRTF